MENDILFNQNMIDVIQNKCKVMGMGVFFLIIAIVVILIVVNSFAAQRDYKDALWKDIMHIGPIPIPWIAYATMDDILVHRTGLVKMIENETRLYLITDVSLEVNIIQRIFGIGNIVLYSHDENEKNIVIRGVRNPKEVKKKISDIIKNSDRPEVIVR